MALATASGPLELEIFEEDVPPRFRLSSAGGALPAQAQIQTIRPGGARQSFAMADFGDYLESLDEIPEPHAFAAEVTLGPPGAAEVHRVEFEEHDHGAHHAHHRDNNMRAAVVHVLADAAVSVLVILGLVLARLFGWLWMDPLAGIIGALVIASWSYGLIRDTAAVLLDMNPDRAMAARLRQAIEAGGDEVADLHLWRLGPGHLGAIVCVRTGQDRGPEHFRARLSKFKALSHLTIEVASTSGPTPAEI
jgi:hypothetical protein